MQKHTFFLLLNISCRNSSQYNGAFSLEFMGFPGISQGFPVTILGIRGYPNLATIVARGSERVKSFTHTNLRRYCCYLLVVGGYDIANIECHVNML